jgi:hypothetical protein
MATDLSGKRLELLREAVPSLSRVALLIDPTNTVKQRTIQAHQAAAEATASCVAPERQLAGTNWGGGPGTSRRAAAPLRYSRPSTFRWR